jgi:hypothetical protein
MGFSIITHEWNMKMSIFKENSLQIMSQKYRRTKIISDTKIFQRIKYFVWTAYRLESDHEFIENCMYFTDFVELEMRIRPYCNPVETTIFEVLKRVNIKTTIFWDMALCSSEDGNKRFGGTCYLHL